MSSRGMPPTEVRGQILRGGWISAEIGSAAGDAWEMACSTQEI